MMKKIRALNDSSDSSSDSDSHSSDNSTVKLTKEAQEQQLYQSYSQALIKIKDGCKEDAKDLLSKLLEQINQLETNQLPSMLDQLKFSILKNLGSLVEDKLDHWMDALDLDPSDVSLWIKAGTRAFHNFHNYQLARNCFHSAVMLSSDNWMAIDFLLDCYFVLHDLYNVVVTCINTLKQDGSYLKAKVLLIESCRLNPSWRSLVPSELQSYFRPPNARDSPQGIKILNNLNRLKENREARMIEDEKQCAQKRQKLFLPVQIGEAPIKVISAKLLKVYDTLNKNGYTILTPLELSFDKCSNGQKDEAASTLSGNDESSSQETTKENGKKSKNSSTKSRFGNSNSNSFPMEYLDKRRSSRVQRLAKGAATDAETVYETIMEMVPSSIKDRIILCTELEVEVCTPVSPNVPVREVEKQAVNRFIESAKNLDTSKHIFFCDLIYLFLVEIVQVAHDLILPSVFTQLYSIYRKHNPLPPVFQVRMDENFSISQAHVTLVANEVTFRPSEEIFLSSIIPLLEQSMDADTFIKFLVRLLYLRGTKGEEVDCMQEVLSILSSKSIQVEAAGKTVINAASVKSSIGSKTEDGLTALLKEEKYDEIIHLLFTKPENEMTVNEEAILSKAIISSCQWDKGIILLNKRDKLTDHRLSLLLECVSGGDRAKVTFKLVQQLAKLATDKFSIKAWCALLWIFISESDMKDKKDDNRLLNLIHIGHQFLGKKGICTGNGGEFLLLCLDYIINRSTGLHRFDKDYASDCFICLFRYPGKRSPPHSSQEIPLEWKHASLLFDFTAPNELPEYDSNKTDSITVDTEDLYTRLAKLVPDECRPDQQSKIISRFLKDTSNTDSLDMTYEKPLPHPVTNDLYFLLADYHFKNKEFKKAKFFFLQDLGMNPSRFDSWASYSLIRSHQLEHLWLQRGDNWTKTEADTFFRMAESCFKCFRQALALDPENSKILIEYSNLVYNVASQTSRLKKYAQLSASKSKSDSGFDVPALKTKQQEYLAIARQAFNQASLLDLDEEQWLPYYMLGKISEKGGQILLALKYYEAAGLNLHTAGAAYPPRIQYYNPPNLSIEAIEVYYRLHATILKYITLRPNTHRRILLKFKNYLIRASHSPITKMMPLNGPRKENEAQEITTFMDDLVSMVQDRFTGQPEQVKNTITSMCLNGLRRVLTRFPEHYKAMYRLSYHYYRSNDARTARDLLILPNVMGPIEQQVVPTAISGLFSDRKPNNFFHGIWRIPVDEIDRPGGFSSHMYHSAFLLIKLCRSLFDYETLSSMAMQLSRPPDAGKKYLREGERLLLARESFDACSSILKNHMFLLSKQDISSLSHFPSLEAFYLQVNKTCDKLVRANVFAEEASRLNSYCHKILKTQTASSSNMQR